MISRKTKKQNMKKKKRKQHINMERVKEVVVVEKIGFFLFLLKERVCAYV